MAKMQANYTKLMSISVKTYWTFKLFIS
jgi:hypothetical protein